MPEQKIGGHFRITPHYKFTPAMKRFNSFAFYANDISSVVSNANVDVLHKALCYYRGRIL